MDHDNHAARVEGKLRAYDRCVADAAGLPAAGVWNPIIHRPGWTTLPEVMLVEQAIESATRQVQAAQQQMQQALEAARQIGQ
jgi:hypothetical protein